MSLLFRRSDCYVKSRYNDGIELFLELFQPFTRVKVLKDVEMFVECL